MNMLPLTYVVQTRDCQNSLIQWWMVAAGLARARLHESRPFHNERAERACCHGTQTRESIRDHNATTTTRTTNP